MGSADGVLSVLSQVIFGVFAVRGDTEGGDDGNGTEVLKFAI